MRGYRAHPGTVEKSRHDVLTEFDLASQAFILERLAASYPDARLVAEEGQAEVGLAEAGLSFAVDPIDGTTNFAHGHPFFCVSIGALWDGAPLAGAVVAPALRIAWHGWFGPDGAAAFRAGEPCRVSRTARLGDALLATGFPPERELAPANNFDSFMRVKKEARGVRRCGAAAIDLCFVADGTYDGYWERRLHLWDAAAAGALVLAAGGSVTALDGGPPRWAAGHLCATNGLIHGALIERVAF